MTSLLRLLWLLEITNSKKTRERVIHAQSSSDRRMRWRHPRKLRKWNRATGDFEAKPDRLSVHQLSTLGFQPHARTSTTPELDKEFEDMTVGELRGAIGSMKASGMWEPLPSCPPGLPLSKTPVRSWLDLDPDDPSLSLFDEEPDGEVRDLLSINWKSGTDDWEGKRWIKVESVVDSGAAAPVAPPTMAPHVQIVPSEGSKRGQKWTSASKHKIPNLGQQQIHACTESGSPTDVMFQIAEVGKPLVSVSAICEKGNRVIFGRAGGVVQNNKTGAETPFYRKNGIYVLSLWLMDEPHTEGSPFGRP